MGTSEPQLRVSGLTAPGMQPLWLLLGRPPLLPVLRAFVADDALQLPRETSRTGCFSPQL